MMTNMRDIRAFVAINWKLLLAAIVLATVVVVLLATGALKLGGQPDVHASKRAPTLDKQGIAYHDGYSCVRTALAGLAKAHLTNNVKTQRDAFRLSANVAVSCNKGAKQDHVKEVTWFTLGAADAVKDLFGDSSGRVACMRSGSCGMSHSTLLYFERIQQGESP